MSSAIFQELPPMATPSQLLIQAPGDQGGLPGTSPETQQGTGTLQTSVALQQSSRGTDLSDGFSFSFTVNISTQAVTAVTVRFSKKKNP